MDSKTLQYRRKFYERLQNVLAERNHHNDNFKERDENIMSEKLDQIMRIIIKRLGETGISSQERLNSLDDEINTQTRELSDQDRFSKLLLIAADTLLTTQIRERTSGTKRFMSETEVAKYAKQKGITVNDALSELVPQGKIEGF